MGHRRLSTLSFPLLVGTRSMTPSEPEVAAALLPLPERGGAGAFAAFPGALPSDRAWRPAAAHFFGLEAIGLGTTEGSEALPDKQARIGEQQGAAGQECCGFVTSIS